MLGGEIYDALHPEFIRRLEYTADKLREFNALRRFEQDDKAKADKLLWELLGSRGEDCHVNQPFLCDYGCNIHVGDHFFANFNLTILDEAEVRIGAHAFIGPNVSIYTACHPLEATMRNTGVEWAEPVIIGDNVWIGGSTTILPGVTIGNNVVIGAGSVVTKDIPDNAVAVGNPARVIRYVDNS